MGQGCVAARARLLVASLAAALLAACASLPPASAPTLPWLQRQAFLQAVAGFDLQGRLGASNGHQGFSASVHWRQQGNDARVTLIGPLGFGQARLQLSGEELRMTTDNGATLEGDAARAQLSDWLGFAPPLSSLRYWVLGVNDPSLPAMPSLDAQHRLVELRQAGWQIDYQEYAAVQRHWLPRRLSISRAELKLRLVINAWQLPAGLPAGRGS